MADPFSTTASAIAVAEALKKIWDVGNAAYHSEKEKEVFNNTMQNLLIQVDSLGKLEAKARESKDDSRYAGFRAVLNSSKQFQDGKDIEPDSTGKEPGVLQRLVDRINKVDAKLAPKHGFRANTRRLLWYHERKDFEHTIAEIKQWTDIVDSILRYDHHIMAIGTDDHVKDTNSRVKNLEDEAAKAAEDRKVAAEERKQAIVREERKAAEKAMKLREARRLEIVRWISPLRFRERQYAILNQAPPSITIPDLLRSEEFDLWARGQSWILHCEGKPGAGKTLFSALVGKHLSEVFEKEGRKVPVLFMYLNYKERDSQSLSNLFASLLKQLIMVPGTSFQSKEAQNLYQGPDSEARPSWKDFYTAFCAEVESYDRVVVIVDALDEASPLDVAPKLLSTLHTLPKDSNNKASVMVTSQRTEDGPLQNLRIQCNRCDKIPLKVYYRCHVCNDSRFYLCQECIDKQRYCEDYTHELTQPSKVMMSIEPTGDEINRYIRAELQAELELGRSGEDDDYPSTLGTTPLGRLCSDKPWLQDEITNSIVARADGMFALAQLYLSSFKTPGLTEPEILEMLDDPPEGYSGLYKQHMVRISEDSFGRIGSNVGMNALMWVACACRPLRFSELQDALAINFRKLGFFNPSARRDKATIVRATAGLITIDNNEADAAVRLSHQTAQQFFDSDRNRWFPNAAAHITRVSLHYLSLKELASPGEGEWEDKEFEMRGIDYPFLKYAYQYWGDHANDAISDPDCQSEIMQFVSDEYKIAATIQAMWYLKSEADVDWDVRKGANALHVCAWFGLNNVLSNLLDQGMDINSRDPKYGQTPLMYACRRGKSSTVALLLSRGARVNAISRRGNSALFEAVSANHIEVLKILLTQPEVDINAAHSRRSDQTALMIAAQEGKVDIVSLLLDHAGIDVYRKDANHNTALSNAIISGQSAAAMQILNHGATSFQLDSTNLTGSSALKLAASEGLGEIVARLLDKGADPSIKDKEGGGTALLRAVDGGHRFVVECMLLNEKVDIHSLDDFGRGVLHGAAIGSHNHAEGANIVQLLLDKGLSANAQDKKGKTPLHDASQSGDIEITKMLLDKGADALLEDNAGRTARTVAWQQGHPIVMKVLEGGNTNEITEEDLFIPDVESLPVWALARLGFTDEIITAIARRPQEIYFLDPDTDDTALHCAVLSEQPEIVEELLKAGMSAEAKNQYHRTPLHLAALKGNIPVLELLLASFEGEEKAGAINSRDQWGRSPVLLAYFNGHIVCCLLLIEAGATIPPSKGSMKQSLFFSAIENGRLEAVQRLAQMGADLQAKNVLGLTGLQMAKEGGRADVEKFLRKSKTRVEGLQISLEGLEDEDDEVLEAAKTKTIGSPPAVTEVLEQSKGVGEPLESPTPSLEERFKALEVPGRRLGARSVEEAKPQNNNDHQARRTRVAQLA